MIDSSDIAGKISAAGWGLFLVWLGASFILQFPQGISLLGVGLIILGAQIARKLYQLNIEIFWVVIGVLFLVGGLSETYGVALPRNFVLPLLMIAAGLGILFSIIKRKRE